MIIQTKIIKSNLNRFKPGSSIIEIIIALGIFIIIAASSVVIILGSFSTTRLAKEKIKATLIAQEGLEAVQSIRNQDWANLVTGTYGLEESTGIWGFASNPDIDSSGKFIRQIIVSDVERDINQEIVSSGGTIDEDSRKATVTVNWSFTPSRQIEVTLETYLTNWQLGKGAASSVVPSPIPSPTPPLGTCLTYCQSLNYSSGTCRQNTQKCSQNSQIYESGGDVLCTGGANVDTCCCTI